MNTPDSADGTQQRVQLQLDIPQARLAELHRLRELAGFDSLRELFSNSLTLLHWAVDQRRQGRSIASVDEEQQTWRELHMPFFDKVAADSASSKPGG